MYYFFNPFADLTQSDEPFRRPPVVQFPGGAFYQVVYVWDVPGVRAFAPAELARLREERITRRGKLRATDGTEYYCDLSTDHRGNIQCETRLTGFYGPAFQPPTNERNDDMKYLEHYKAHILEVYADDSDSQSQVREGLAECPTFGTVQNYLQSFWDKKAITILTEDFFAKEVMACV